MKREVRVSDVIDYFGGNHPRVKLNASRFNFAPTEIEDEETHLSPKKETKYNRSVVTIRKKSSEERQK
jgi:hypothetical protein